MSCGQAITLGDNRQKWVIKRKNKDHFVISYLEDQSMCISTDSNKYNNVIREVKE